MEEHIVATYTLIYRFLKQQSKDKAAEGVKKAAKSIVALQDDIVQEGPPLEDIVKEWMKSREKSDKESSSEESDSSDETSSDSSSADSDSESEDDDSSDGSDSEEESPAKKSPRKPVERDTSVTLSSAGEKVVVSQPTNKNSSSDENEDAESDSSDSDSSDSDDSSKEPTNKNDENEDAESDSDSDSSDSDDSSKATSDKSDAESSSDSSDSSSSSESSDEEEDKETNTQPPPDKTTVKRPSSSEPSSESSSESEDESDPEPEAHPAKKRKISESGATVATTHPPSISQPIVDQKKQKPAPNAKERFQRVKVQNIAPDTLLNNGYEARGGASNDYGERAHRDLIVTRGAGFRKEKNKKKRGSYRGGEITMETRSIKFDF